MTRCNTRKTRANSDRDSSHAEAVERLQDAVGRLVARRVLREWAQGRGPRDAAPPRPGGSGRPG